MTFESKVSDDLSTVRRLAREARFSLPKTGKAKKAEADDEADEADSPTRHGVVKRPTKKAAAQPKEKP